MNNEEQDADALGTLNKDVQNNLNPWTDLGLFAIGLYVLLGWGRVCWWLIQRWKLTIPLAVFLFISCIHGCTFATNAEYRNRLRELAEMEKARKAAGH